MPKLYRVILPVSDIDQAAVFYGQVLNASGQRISPGRHYFDCDGTILACYDPVADGDSLDEGWRFHSNQYIYFAVADIKATFDRAKDAGCRELDERIETMPWGERLFYAKDPFGNPICFVDENTLFTGS
jgi:predicted enzyme related to lactoylglutathione lyase